MKSISERVMEWLRARIEAAHEDADSHPDGSAEQAFYRGQAIAYENALGAVKQEDKT